MILVVEGESVSKKERTFYKITTILRVVKIVEANSLEKAITDEGVIECEHNMSFDYVTYKAKGK